ncbi:uncharacterized protein A4U43_C10F19220 [Asparagus officinalis]|uniref:UDP-glucose:glycoprotein glucosyltransferase n=2 Tax=Asparagus officinalis TaxID=4686 RepID=A0A5P1E5U5_ASPOF|nr:uncharacterized protein A4U43_C10F19220 [Asparagus officinalis]
MASLVRSRVLLSSLWILLLLTGIVAAEHRRPKSVQVSLRAKWPGTSLLMEAGELLSKQSNGLFWEFTDLWLQLDRGSDCQSARCCIKKIVDDGRSMLSNHLGSIFEFSLTLRSASPRLVLYRQLAEDSLSSFSIDEEVGSLNFTGDESGRVADSSVVSNNQSIPPSSCCWVDTGSMLLFNVSQLLSWLDTSFKQPLGASENPELFEFDHIYDGLSIAGPIAIFYGALGTECFNEFHVALVDASKKGKVRYVVRPVLPIGCPVAASSCSVVGTSGAVNLGGYGVELALKNMEYKAMDDSAIKKGVTLEDPRTDDLTQEVRGFIFSKIMERKPELTAEVMAFRDYLLSSTISDTLEVWELKDLGHQTAQRIVQASDPLQSMQEINQNFPSIVSSLSRMKLNESVKDEIIANQRMVPPGKSLMALNGALINIEDIDLYMLMDLVHEELLLADQLSRIKLPQSAIRKILSAAPPSESNSFRVDFRSSHVHYLNNLEEDAMYRRWRNNINEILMPVFPGQLRYIRKNLFHAVYVLDPATSCGAESIDMILSMYQSNVPMRFGVILYSSKLIKTIEEKGHNYAVNNEAKNGEDISSLIIRLFIYIKENYTTQLAFQFLSNVNKIWSVADDLHEEAPEAHHVEAAFVETVLPKADSPPQDTLLKLQREGKYVEEAKGSSLFVFKLGLSKRHCCLLMNGLVQESSEDAAMNAMNEELPRIQEQVYYGYITSKTDVLEKFLSESGHQRYNPQILGEGKEKKKFISLFTLFFGGETTLQEVKYLHSSETADDLKPVTHLLAVNASSREGMKLLHEGINYLIEGSTRARLGVLFYGNSEANSPALLLAKVFERTVSSFSHKENVLEFLDQLCTFYESQYISVLSLASDSLSLFVEKISELAEMHGLPSDDYKSILSSVSSDMIKKQMDKVFNLLSRQIGPEFGNAAVITNGKVLIPIGVTSFLSDDFSLLESVEYDQRIKYISEIIEEVDWKDIDPDDLTSKFYSDLIMLASSSMAIRERSSERAHFEILNAEHSAVIMNNANSALHIDAVIDPLSPAGQKLSPLLRVLWKCIQPSMRIILNPISSLADLPLKNFYRYVVPSVDDFSAVDYSVNGPKAFFSNMPLSKTLTMNLDVPEPWLVEPTVAIHDLDNILLENLGDVSTLQAVFELEALLLTGHCSEKNHDPPRGLQLFLGTKQMPHVVDTLVMANLGYWQMKVSPGVWYLQLAPGRSADLYVLKESEDESLSSKRITINDLRGKVLHIEVAKKRGKEHEELLIASDDNKVNERKTDDRHSWNANLLKWASGFIGGNGKKSLGHKKTERHGETINVFSVASGHLYERFLKIMILSVLKNTQRPVKFWFIKNYLSPQFKDFIPHMADEYGFEYELITYKWPTWLHKQKEKQRIIWAYKIFF